MWKCPTNQNMVMNQPRWNLIFVNKQRGVFFKGVEITARGACSHSPCPGGSTAHSRTLIFCVRIIQAKAPDFELTLNAGGLITDLTNLLLKRLHLTPAAITYANMELVYQIFSSSDAHSFGIWPMFSDRTIKSLLEMSSTSMSIIDTTPMLCVSIVSPDINIFRHNAYMLAEWKPPRTFLYSSLPAELNVRLIHCGADYKLQQKILTKSKGVTVKQLIRDHCFHACSSDLVAQDPSLPGVVGDHRLQLFIQKEGKTMAATDHPHCELLDGWPVSAAMLMLTGDPTFHDDIVVLYVISPSSPPIMTPVTGLPSRLRSWETDAPVLAHLVIKKNSVTNISERGIGAFLTAIRETPPEDPCRKKLMEYCDHCYFHRDPMPQVPFLRSMRITS